MEWVPRFIPGKALGLFVNIPKLWHVERLMVIPFYGTLEAYLIFHGFSPEHIGSPYNFSEGSTVPREQWSHLLLQYASGIIINDLKPSIAQWAFMGCGAQRELLDLSMHTLRGLQKRHNLLEWSKRSHLSDISKQTQDQIGSGWPGVVLLWTSAQTRNCLSYSSCVCCV